MDLFTIVYVFNSEEAARMAKGNPAWDGFVSGRINL